MKAYLIQDCMGNITYAFVGEGLSAKRVLKFQARLRAVGYTLRVMHAGSSLELEDIVDTLELDDRN